MGGGSRWLYAPAGIAITCAIKINAFRNVEIVAFELGDYLGRSGLFCFDRDLIQISTVVIDQTLLDYLPFNTSGNSDAPYNPQFHRSGGY